VRSAEGDAAPAGTTVTVDQEGGRQVGRRALDGAGGGWRVDGLPQGRYTVVTDAPGHAVRSVSAEVAAGTVTRVEVVLSLAAEVAGVVRQRPGGAVLPGTVLSLVDHAGDVVATTTSAPDGSFGFSGLAAGRYTLVPAGYGSLTRAVSAGAGATTRVELSLGGGQP
jgi:hypothetical protein